MKAARLVSEEFHGDWQLLWNALKSGQREEAAQEFRNAISRLCEIPGACPDIIAAILISTLFLMFCFIGVGPVLVDNLVSFAQDAQSR